MNELHKVLIAAWASLLLASSIGTKRDIPYAILAPAFLGLIRWLLSQSEAEPGRWRGALTGALSPNSQLILNLVPEMELVIRKQLRVIDDMYSLDAATLELLEHLITRPGVRHLK